MSRQDLPDDDAPGRSDTSPSGSEDAPTRSDEVIAKFLLASEQAEPPGKEHFLRLYPELRRQLEAFFETYEMLQGESSPRRPSQFAAWKQIGRYRLIQVVAEGSYGVVWLGYDPQLLRPVAIKVSSSKLIGEYRRTQLLAEAQQLAGLHHPNIVPLYDVGETQDGEPYLISRFIAGQDLSSYIRHREPTAVGGCREVVRSGRWMLQVAKALQASHAGGIIHRDVKPGNILLDESLNALLTDFGLSDSAGKGAGGVPIGTLAYISPEQISASNPDARSDIWSLGVTLYELLTGQKPFEGSSHAELLASIESNAPPPMLVSNVWIDAEIERICLRCLTKEPERRYANCEDLISDLTEWERLHGIDLAVLQPNRKVTPRSLESLDAADHELFLKLVPGDFADDGLPAEISYWKSLISGPNSGVQVDSSEESGRESPLLILYGPSGSGKSSFVKAGLMPLLDFVQCDYLEAAQLSTPDDFLEMLRRECETQEPATTVSEAIKQRQDNTSCRKLVVFVDQFEQFLSTLDHPGASWLHEALDTADGNRVQFVLLVRDDYWMSLCRFLATLGVLPGPRNSRAYDSPNSDNAKALLVHFGRGLGTLALEPERFTAENRQFIESAVDMLSVEDRVPFSVLTTFALMMSNARWDDSKFESMGGVEQIGVRYLDKELLAAGAFETPEEHQRLLQILFEFLPSESAKTSSKLLTLKQLVQYIGETADSEVVSKSLQLLVDEKGLLTRTELGEGGQRIVKYRLTHDFLVPAVRGLRERRRQLTSQGRAEIALEGRTAAWSVSGRSHYLPGIIGYTYLRLMTRADKWTATQRFMMATAARRHLLTVSAISVCLLFTIWFSIETLTRTRVSASLMALETASPENLSEICSALRPHHSRVHAELASKVEEAETTGVNPKCLLHLNIASVLVEQNPDTPTVNRLLDELLDMPPEYVHVLSNLSRFSAAREEMQRIFGDESETDERRFGAALPLCEIDSVTQQWREEDFAFLCDVLTSTNPEQQAMLRTFLHPIRSKLVTSLRRMLSSESESEAVRLNAASALADFVDDPIALTQIAMDANTEQYQRLLPKLLGQFDDQLAATLQEIVESQPSVQQTSEQRIRVGRRRAAAAETLIRGRALFPGRKPEFDVSMLGPLFEFTDDPEAMSQFITRLRHTGMEASTLFAVLKEEIEQPRYENDLQYGLLLCLGEYLPAQFSSEEFGEIVTTVQVLYREHPSSQIHGASGWLLQRWGLIEEKLEVDHTQINFVPGREWFTVQVDVPPSEKQIQVASRASLNGRKLSAIPSQFWMTFIVFPEGEYLLGSPKDEFGYQFDELERKVKITQPFAVCDREVTWEQYIAFGLDDTWNHFINDLDKQISGDAAIQSVHWYPAIDYCRWMTATAGLPESQQCYAPRSTLDLDADGNPVDWTLDLTKGGFRLLTDSEWEVMCRAGTSTAFSFGSDEKLMQFYGHVNDTTDQGGRSGGDLRPNLRGIFDAHGGEREWCHDWYEPNVEKVAHLPTGPPRSDPSKPRQKTLRSGDKTYLTQYCRSSSRAGYVPLAFACGFRVGMSLKSEAK